MLVERVSIEDDRLDALTGESSPFRTRLGLRKLATDRRWQTDLYLSSLDGQASLCLPVTSTPDATTLQADYRALAPDDGTQWFGGHRFQRPVLLTAPHASLEELRAGANAIFDAALAARPGERAVFAFAGGDLPTGILAALSESSSHSIDSQYSIALLPLNGARSLDQWLQSQPGRTRQLLRRDLRTIRQRTAVDLDFSSSVSQVARAVWSGLNSHGIADHPALIEMRLREWQSDNDVTVRLIGEHAASAIESYAVVLIVGSVATVYEIGFGEDLPDKLDAYLHLMIYRPIELAAELGLKSIDLGFHSERTKELRGAKSHPLTHYIWR